jgi:antitoxin (DNA-binding transcriptional repressor) of toxin-antitoxin stability system
MRFAGRFILVRSRYVRWQWSRLLARLSQDLIITAQGGTLARITPITGITVIAMLAVTSRRRGAWTPAPGRHAPKPWQRPA